VLPFLIGVVTRLTERCLQYRDAWYTSLHATDTAVNIGGLILTQLPPASTPEKPEAQNIASFRLHSLPHTHTHIHTHTHTHIHFTSAPWRPPAELKPREIETEIRVKRTRYPEKDRRRKRERERDRSKHGSFASCTVRRTHRFLNLPHSQSKTVRPHSRAQIHPLVSPIAGFTGFY
jgi:hypothetical protein